MDKGINWVNGRVGRRINSIGWIDGWIKSLID